MIDTDWEKTMSEHTEKQSFEGSATRSKQDGRYDLISPHGLRALARRLMLGAERHGERNWESGGEKFRQASVSHMMAHLASYMESPNQEDADALICNAMFLCHFEALKLKAPADITVTIQFDTQTLQEQLAKLQEAARVPDDARCIAVGQMGRCDLPEGHEGNHRLDYAWQEPCQTIHTTGLVLCLELFYGHTCVRKKGHKGPHARYGINS